MNDAQPRIAYLVSRFPHFTETFIVGEIHEVLNAGLDVSVYALRDFRQDAVQPDAEVLLPLVTWGNRLPATEMIRAIAGWLVRRPIRTLGIWVKAIAGNLRSPKFLGRALLALPAAMTFAHRMQRGDVQHIHAHWATHPALAAWVIHQLTGIPYSVTVHAHDLYVERPMIERKLGDAAAVVTISEFNRRILTEIHPPLVDRLHVIPCGVRLDDFGPGERGDHRVVCVGSLQEYKGQRYLIDAARILTAQGRDLSVVLVGDGELRSELQAQVARLGLGSTVEFAGHQPTGRITELLSTATVVVQPSVVTASGKMEGIPVALMEALASQAAVVATDISGISELVSDCVTGRLVPQRDAAALADAIATLLDDEELRTRLGRSGRERVASAYDLERNAEALVRLLTATPIRADEGNEAVIEGATS